MSLSVHPAYLAERGIKGDGGPMHDKYITDNAVLYRNIAWRDETGATVGFYDLTGKGAGALIYVWTDLAFK